MRDQRDGKKDKNAGIGQNVILQKLTPFLGF